MEQNDNEQCIGADNSSETPTWGRKKEASSPPEGDKMTKKQRDESGSLTQSLNGDRTSTNEAASSTTINDKFTSNMDIDIISSKKTNTADKNKTCMAEIKNTKDSLQMPKPVDSSTLYYGSQVFMQKSAGQPIVRQPSNENSAVDATGHVAIKDSD